MKDKEKPAAILKIDRAQEMSLARRKEIATWLRKQANSLIKEGDNYSNWYTARIIYYESSQEA